MQRLPKAISAMPGQYSELDELEVVSNPLCDDLGREGVVDQIRPVLAALLR